MTMTKYKWRFSKKKLRNLKGPPVKIYVNKKVKPTCVFYFIFLTTCSERQRVTEPLKPTEWTEPVVLNNSVRLFKDHKLAVNQVSKLEQYFIQQMEYLLTSLSKRQTFTKLDLRHAFLQILFAD